MIALAALWPLMRIYGGIAIPHPAGMRRDFAPVYAIAFPAILAQIAPPVGQAYVTRAMAGYGEEAVAGMAIVGRLVPVAFGVVFALSGAVGPILGQNFGAGNMVRVRRGFADAVMFAFIVIVVVSGCCLCCARRLRICLGPPGSRAI